MVRERSLSFKSKKAQNEAVKCDLKDALKAIIQSEKVIFGPLIAPGGTEIFRVET